MVIFKLYNRAMHFLYIAWSMRICFFMQLCETDSRNNACLSTVLKNYKKSKEQLERAQNWIKLQAILLWIPPYQLARARIINSLKYNYVNYTSDLKKKIKENKYKQRSIMGEDNPWERHDDQYLWEQSNEWFRTR